MNPAALGTQLWSCGERAGRLGREEEGIRNRIRNRQRQPRLRNARNSWLGRNILWRNLVVRE